MNPRNVFKFNRPGIEILLATLSFSDKCTMQVVLLYRSPQIPMQHLLTVLISVFNTLDFSLPSIVLGDFNEDFSPLALNEPDTTRLSQVMRDHSYNQLVKKCTTDRGTLIQKYVIATTVITTLSYVQSLYNEHINFFKMFSTRAGLF